MLRRPNPYRAAALATVSSYPTLPGVYYGFTPARALGPQTEGLAGALSTTPRLGEVLVVPGSTVPTSGQDVLARWTGTRWVSDAFGVPVTTGHTLAGCPCATTPDTLTMTVNDPTKNFGIFHSCTIVFTSPVPSPFASLALGSFAWISTASFTDQFSANPFWYYFTCSQGYYALSRIYPKTGSGPAFLDSVRMKWLAGFGTNTCDPFNLDDGLMFAGGDTSETVVITG
jgi:hypothetical protein